MDRNHINFDAFAVGLYAADKVQALQNMACLIGRQTGIDAPWLSNQLLLNEMHENSAVGHGVAIMHLKSTPLKQPFTILGKLNHAVDFAADDGQGVDIICAVLSSQADGPHHLQKHLQRLSRVTRLPHDASLIDMARLTKSESELADLFQQYRPQSLAA